MTLPAYWRQPDARPFDPRTPVVPGVRYHFVTHVRNGIPRTTVTQTNRAMRRK